MTKELVQVTSVCNQEEMELSTQVVLHANVVYTYSSSNQGERMSSKLEYTAV